MARKRSYYPLPSLQKEIKMDLHSIKHYELISLDAHLKSNLDWNRSIDLANKALDEGKKILWDLDFGLFDRLQYPLENQQQFLSLRLAIEHFENVIWNKFSNASLGVCLYRGRLDYIEAISSETIKEWALERFDNLKTHSFGVDRFMQSLYCRDVALDYMKQLAANFPFGVNNYIFSENPLEMSSAEYAIFFNEEIYRPLILVMDERIASNRYSNIGICLPPVNCYSPQSIGLLDQAVKQLSIKGSHYRFIPEESLITSIAGLDELYVAPSTLSSQGNRRLQGFCAAGGIVHYLE